MTSAPPSAAVTVNYAVPRRGVPAANSFRAWARAALLAHDRHRRGEIAIRLVGAREGRALNRRYRQRDHATNVLSFPAELPPGVDLPLLGDIVICAPVVAREAAEQGKRLRDHYAHLTVHGVLHLLGHEHRDVATANRMEALEVRVLAGFGIADPYA